MSTPAQGTRLPHIQGVPVFFPEGKVGEVWSWPLTAL